MTVFETIDRPEDLRALTRDELGVLAAETRAFLIEKVSRTGGHLGPNLGVVELTIALHRVFSSPKDMILWDTGHQAYVHKIFTGRRAGFDQLRQQGGLSGYPRTSESEHDIIENSHASTALAYADGLAKACQLRGVTDRAVVAVIGDGALTGGMAWEALNNIAAAKDRPVIIVVNDNTRSYAPTIGGLAVHLAALRTARGYEGFLAGVKQTLKATPVIGGPLYTALHGLKKGLSDILVAQGMFTGLGLKYLGPFDGHDVETLETALHAARGFGGPVIVHCITQKGRGYPPAEENELDHLHTVRAAGTRTAAPAASSARSWTSVFSDELVTLGRRSPEIVAVTAAMLEPTGLQRFQREFPSRVFDVGIAEQHAVASAAGLAMGGLHPVVAIYATFVNRAFDQVMMDVGLHRCGVTFVLDRAGVTGDDGPSHNGMWDLSILRVVPGLRICAPRDAATLRTGLREAIADSSGPTALRFPKGAVGPDIPAVGTISGMDVLCREGAEDVLLIGVGAMARVGVEVAERLTDQGIGVTVVDPRWIIPVNSALAPLAARHRLVVTVEDNGRAGGVGCAVAQALRDAGVGTRVHDFGLPQRFLDHGKRPAILDASGLSAQRISVAIVEQMAKSEPAVTKPAPAVTNPGPAVAKPDTGNGNGSRVQETGSAVQ
jgi:1-deoxy-D-xylulose-5-phosphate synthase